MTEPASTISEIAPARGGHRVAAVVAALCVGIALIAAWLVPPLAMVVVWPLLFVVPGWGVISAVRPRIGATGRLGLAIVLSVAISAHLVYWLSVATGGYRRETIFGAALLLALPIPWAVARRGAGSLLAGARSAGGAVRREPIAFGLAGLTASFVGLILSGSLWQASQGGIAAGGSNWSDLGVHLSIAQSLNAGNFPPQVPYFAGAPLVYHWFADFHAAIAAQAAGMFAVPAFVVGSAILSGALALLVHGLARQLLRGDRARRAALLATALVIFGGGLGWIRLVGDLQSHGGDLVGLVSAHSYDNSWYDAAGQVSWPYFRIPSVMGTGLLVHRATTAGLPILLGAIVLLVAGLPDRRSRAAGRVDRPVLIGLAGLLGALLAPFHFFFFPAFLAIALLWVVIGGRLFDRDAPRNAALLLVPYLLAIPFALPPFLASSGSGQLVWRGWALWESAPMADGPAAVVFFYATNLGVPFLLAVGALLVLRMPRRAFLAAWLVLLFAVPNLVQVSVVAFDMNKYFQAMWIAVALAAAWLIRRWPAPAVALVLALSVPSPLLVSSWTALNHLQVLSATEVDAEQWIVDHTPQASVFVTNGWLNSPTDAAGRLRLMTFSPYVANLGYDPDERLAQIDRIYCGNDPADAARIARSLGAGYLLDTGPPRGCAPRTEFEGAADWTLVFSESGVRIFVVAEAPATSAAQGSVSFVR